MPGIDVVVLGTGAAGLTAAITAHDSGASVAVYEKAQTVGGTSAWSGGQIWIPINPHQLALGKPDSRDDALTYLNALSHGMTLAQFHLSMFLMMRLAMLQRCTSDGPS